MNDFLNELNSYVVEDEAKALGIELADDNFAVVDFEQANYLLRRIAELSEERDNVENTAKEQIQSYASRINAFTDARLNEIDGKKNYMSIKLEEYAKKELEGKKDKSVKLAFGNIGFKKNQPKFTYEDDILIKSLEGINPAYINSEIKRSINKKDLKKEIKIIDGVAYLGETAIDGIKIEMLEDSFNIKLK